MKLKEVLALIKRVNKKGDYGRGVSIDTIFFGKQEIRIGLILNYFLQRNQNSILLELDIESIDSNRLSFNLKSLDDTKEHYEEILKAFGYEKYFSVSDDLVITRI